MNDKNTHTYILNCHNPSNRRRSVIRGKLGSSPRNTNILLYNNMV